MNNANKFMFFNIKIKTLYFFIKCCIWFTIYKTITGNSIAHLYEYVNKRYAEQQVLLEVLNLKMTVLTNLLIEKFGWDINEIETPTPEGLEYLTLDLDFVQEKTREIYTKYDIKARKITRDVKKEIKEKIKK